MIRTPVRTVWCRDVTGVGGPPVSWAPGWPAPAPRAHLDRVARVAPTFRGVLSAELGEDATLSLELVSAEIVLHEAEPREAANARACRGSPGKPCHCRDRRYSLHVVRPEDRSADPDERPGYRGPGATILPGFSRPGRQDFSISGRTHSRSKNASVGP